MTASRADHSDIQIALAWAKTIVSARGLDRLLLSTPDFSFSESDLLRELAWVVLCSGFRERVVRRLFGKISLCFFDWESATIIAKHSAICVATAMDVFGSRPKITAIARSAAFIEARGFDSMQRNIVATPIEALQAFPFIGKITAFHLAKNLGFNVSKPDRHLQRISLRHGYSDAQDFCNALASASGESVRDDDTLLWRVSEMGLENEMHFASIALPPQRALACSL
jgi:hypothetical protein